MSSWSGRTGSTRCGSRDSIFWLLVLLTAEEKNLAPSTTGAKLGAVSPPSEKSANSPEQLLARARAGDSSALGALLGLYRNYLRLLAQPRIGVRLQQRLDASDVVQETLMEAYRDFEDFEGNREQQILSWLRRILVRNLADAVKYHRAHRRDLERQQSIEAFVDRSTKAVQALAAETSTPSRQVSRREQAVILADVLTGLPEDYREVLKLRHLDQLKFEEVAGRMGRSTEAVRKLWARALAKLRTALQDK